MPQLPNIKTILVRADKLNPQPPHELHRPLREALERLYQHWQHKTFFSQPLSFFLQLFCPSRQLRFIADSMLPFQFGFTEQHQIMPKAQEIGLHRLG